MLTLLMTRRRLLTRLVCASATTIGVLSDDRRSLAAEEPPWPAHGDPPFLIAPSLLQSMLSAGSQSIVVLDLSPLRHYRQRHLPGSYHVWWQDTMEVNFPVYGTVLRPEGPGLQERRQQLLHDWGVTDATFVVAYDDNRNRWAARAVWFLRFLGHDQAAVLDGGLEGWQAAGGDVASGKSPQPPSDRPEPSITPRDGYYIWTDQLQTLLASQEIALVDLRTEEESHDTLNGQVPLGRIPGSISIPWTSTTRDDAGHLKSPNELEALFAGAGVTRDRQVVVYAQFGVGAAHGWWVLKLLAYPRVVVYDWGWAGWATTPGLPIAPVGSS